MPFPPPLPHTQSLILNLWESTAAYSMSFPPPHSHTLTLNLWSQLLHILHPSTHPILTSTIPHTQPVKWTAARSRQPILHLNSIGLRYFVYYMHQPTANISPSSPPSSLQSSHLTHPTCEVAGCTAQTECLPEEESWQTTRGGPGRPSHVLTTLS